MNDGSKENLKKNVVELGLKIKEFGNYRAILINLLNEAKTNQNIKLSNLLRDLEIEEEISHLTDWIRFHKNKIINYKRQIKSLKVVVRQELCTKDWAKLGDITWQDAEQPDKEIIEGLEDLSKEVRTITRERELEQKKGLGLEIKIPTPEELEEDVGKDAGTDSIKPEIKAEKPKIKSEREIDLRKSLGEKLAAVKDPITNIFEKTRKFNNQIVKYAVPVALLLLIVTGLFVFKPGITGYITLTKEKTYEDNLNLVMNESGNYTWAVDNIGDIQSIKASGRVEGNGTVKIYIEKDGQRYLIYDNKQEG